MGEQARRGELPLLSRDLRVAQAEGPFVLKFRDTPGLETFLNIDGEYFRLLQPDRLVVKLCSALQDGRLKALMRQK